MERQVLCVGHDSLDEGTGVVMVEQPMAKDDYDGNAWITENSPCRFSRRMVQRLTDIERLKGVFSGINIKLMKCTGMREAWKMRHLAQVLGMKVRLAA